MSDLGEPYRGTSYPMPSHLERDSGILAERYDVVAITGDEKVHAESLRGFTEEDFIELRTLEQHDIVKETLRQRLSGMPAPMSIGSQVCPGTAGVFFGSWEAKHNWDGQCRHDTYDCHCGELLQINRVMYSEGSEGVSLAQGHQGDRTGRDLDRSRLDRTHAKFSFTSAKDDNGQCLIKYVTQSHPCYDRYLEYNKLQSLSAWAKKRQGDKRAKLSRAELVRLHVELYGEEHDDDYDDETYFESGWNAESESERESERESESE
jgi:hypothetical protein